MKNYLGFGDFKYNYFNNLELAEKTVRRVIEVCSITIINRKDFKGIDTVLLRNALYSKSIILQRQFYWNLYSIIAYEFERHFDNDFEKLPFSKDKVLFGNFVLLFFTLKTISKPDF